MLALRMVQHVSEDRQTLEFYAREATTYVHWSCTEPSRHLDLFLSDLSANARILELGCGAGSDSAAMIARGFDVTPTDASPELAASATSRLARTVSVLAAGDLSAVSEFDAIWASACLLHVPLQDLADVIARINTALKPEGRFYASYKSGQAEGRDRFGRYYNNPSAPQLEDIYRNSSWNSLHIKTNPGSGYDGESTTWLHVTAVKP